MSGFIVSNPKRDMELYNNKLGGFVRRTEEQLEEDAEYLAVTAVMRAKKEAAERGLSVLMGRIDLTSFRSDEVEVLIEYLKKFLLIVIGAPKTHTVPVFTIYEKLTETTVVNNVRDITFNATRTS